MQVIIRCVGQKGPDWLQSEVEKYCKRLSHPYSLCFEIVPHSKNKNPELQKSEEAKKLLNCIPKNCLMIATAINGKSYSTDQVANIIQEKSLEYQKAIIFIGGCNGLCKSVTDSCQIIWSLSNLTLPHTHVRLILAEQLYRISCIHKQHPYHK